MAACDVTSPLIGIFLCCHFHYLSEFLSTRCGACTPTSPPKPSTLHPSGKHAHHPPQTPQPVSLTFPKGPPQLFASTPFKRQPEDPIAVLRRNLSDTLTFLHQERNAFLPEDDEIVPSRKDDHIARDIDLGSINSRPLKRESLREAVGSKVDEVLREAEEVVNERLRAAEELTNNFDSCHEDAKTITEDSLENLESLKDDSVSVAQEKSEEAFRFLENEASSPIEAVTKSPKSGIPVAKPRSSAEESSLESESSTKIPVMKGKVRTIKKHSKDPLKEFVTLSKDFDWDEDDSSTPSGKTPVVSKIPVLKAATSPVVSPGSHVSTKSSTIDSESDDDSRRSPALKGILKKVVRTVGSSSGSDVALHEEGAELSDDESEDFYQQEPHFTITTTEEIDPVTGAKITRTVRTASQMITSPNQNEEDFRHSMQTVVDQFMSEERIPH